MLTFSRAAATEFKKRLKELIGTAANFMEIKPFHSYCFDLIEKVGNLEEVDNVVNAAVQMIRNDDVELRRFTKNVLVIDEAQDMDTDEFDLIKALIAVNSEMRVIAAVDDYQNIFEFRDANSKYLRSLVTDYNACLYELNENYRSKSAIVKLTNEFAKPLANRLKNNDIVAVSKEKGIVQLIHYTSRQMEEAVAENILKTRTQGSSCVMTNTNEEAFRLLGLLLQKGIHAKLIQSNDGFSLNNLAEIRFFLKMLFNVNQNPVISDEQWKTAKERLKEKYKDSTCLENCLNMLSDFEMVYNEKYKSDLYEFIREFHYEDFYSDEQGTVYVSTIHKSKGREFDNVYIMLDKVSVRKDEERRKLYVAMTRAKNALYIHYNNNLFDFFNIPEIEKISDTYQYSEPKQIALQLTHHDVFLDFFKSKKSLILQLHSGSPLSINNEFLKAEIEGKIQIIGKLSKDCISKMEYLKERGYAPTRVEVRFIVAWRSEDDLQETAVLLPNIYYTLHSDRCPIELTADI